jgi:hypothetical protein
MMYYAEPVVVSPGVVSWANGCESCCDLLRQWLWITVLFWASGSESWWIMISRCLWIMVCYAETFLLIVASYTEPVAVKHGVLCWARGCEPCCVKLIQWLWIIVRYDEPMVGNHVVLCWASDCESQCYSEPVVMNHCVLFWASGCE